jgi:hypothetical protein
VVRSPASVVVGNEGVIAATMATLHEFPDRTLLGEDVIWSGTIRGRGCCRRTAPVDRDPSGRRRLWRGDGQAAGLSHHRRLPCRANVIDDEWLIRDQGAIVRQMGWEPKAYAARPDRARGRAGGLRETALTPRPTMPAPMRAAATTTPGGSATPIC